MLATNIIYAARSKDYSGIGPLDLLLYRPGQYQLNPGVSVPYCRQLNILCTAQIQVPL